jgi:hypothetical protein
MKKITEDEAYGMYLSWGYDEVLPFKDEFTGIDFINYLIFLGYSIE